MKNNTLTMSRYLSGDLEDYDHPFTVHFDKSIPVEVLDKAHGFDVKGLPVPNRGFYIYMFKTEEEQQRFIKWYNGNLLG